MRISKRTQRRFVLGMQGLWPGRRWKGSQGARDAVLCCRRIRADPLDVVGRSQDLAFLSRVADYDRGVLDKLLYEQHVGFEHGGALSIFPRELLSLHWSWVRNEGLPVRWEKWFSRNAQVVRRVKREIENRGPLESREYAKRERTEDYRSSRLEGLALYYLWRNFDILIHHREGNRRFYDLTERIFGQLPEPFAKDATLNEMAYETMSWLGLSGKEGIPYLRTNEDGRGRSKLTKLEVRQRLIDDGRLTEVEIEGERQTAVLRSDARGLLEEVASGGLPRSWRPLGDETEAVLLAPLDITIANERSRTLFNFEYLWEVYKPARKRRWGYYVLPVLYGDQIVGRIEPIYNREDRRLRIINAWWEPQADLSQLPRPFALCLSRLARFLGARGVALENAGPPRFKAAVDGEISSLMA